MCKIFWRATALPEKVVATSRAAAEDLSSLKRGSKPGWKGRKKGGASFGDLPKAPTVRQHSAKSLGHGASNFVIRALCFNWGLLEDLASEGVLRYALRAV